MIDLKPYIDNVTNAQATHQKIVNAIDAAMQLGTPEGKEQALAMVPELDQAENAKQQAEQFYQRMVNAAKGSDVLKNFVPVSDTQTTDDSKAKSVMNRKEFFALAAAEQKTFALNGGKVVDSEVNNG